LRVARVEHEERHLRPVYDIISTRDGEHSAWGRLKERVLTGDLRRRSHPWLTHRRDAALMGERSCRD